MFRKKYVRANTVILFNILNLVDAYVALGGDPDSNGYIIKSKLVSILSEEFELAFDIEDLLE